MESMSQPSRRRKSLLSAELARGVGALGRICRVVVTLARFAGGIASISARYTWRNEIREIVSER